LLFIKLNKYRAQSQILITVTRPIAYLGSCWHNSRWSSDRFECSQRRRV